MSDTLKGKIIRGVGGFYDVHTPEGVFRCRARGLFRKLKVKPLVGDDVELIITDTKDMEGSVLEILPRQSELLRPAVANVTQAMVIFSFISPALNPALLDLFLIHMKVRKLPCLICFNKSDLLSKEELEGFDLAESYKKAGYSVIFTRVSDDGSECEGLAFIRDYLRGHITTVAGPSGVGKSSLINALQGSTVMETGEISHKIERGRHTTRHTELIYTGDGGYIMDTPGFTSLRLPGISPSELEAAYPEFEPFRESCRFNGCSHTHEPDCSIKAAVEEGLISSLRYKNYCQFYKELKA